MTRMPDLATFQAAPDDAPILPCQSAVTGLERPEIQPGDDQSSQGVVARLCASFRVVVEAGSDPRQWMLQRRSISKGVETWQPISFCVTRAGLLLAIRDKCIPPATFQSRLGYPGLDPSAIAAIEALPERFRRFRARRS